jgi:hypothetical protein
MSMHSLSVRTATVTLLAAGLVGGALTLAPPAGAEPGRGDRTCARHLQQAGAWPGAVSVRGVEHRLYSDAYMTYLARQAPCSPLVS